MSDGRDTFRVDRDAVDAGTHPDYPHALMARRFEGNDGCEPVGWLNDDQARDMQWLIDCVTPPVSDHPPTPEACHNRFVEPWDCAACNPEGFSPSEWRANYHAAQVPGPAPASTPAPDEDGVATDGTETPEHFEARMRKTYGHPAPPVVSSDRPAPEGEQRPDDWPKNIAQARIELGEAVRALLIEAGTASPWATSRANKFVIDFLGRPGASS